MTFVVRRDDGKFLNQVKGTARDWTIDLNQAQVFPSIPKARNAYRWATEYARRHNANNARRRKHGMDVSRDLEIPEFRTAEVTVVLKEPAA